MLWQRRDRKPTARPRPARRHPASPWSPRRPPASPASRRTQIDQAVAIIAPARRRLRRRRGRGDVQGAAQTRSSSCRCRRARPRTSSSTRWARPPSCAFRPVLQAAACARPTTVPTPSPQPVRATKPAHATKAANQHGSVDQADSRSAAFRRTRDLEPVAVAQPVAQPVARRPAPSPSPSPTVPGDRTPRWRSPDELQQQFVDLTAAWRGQRAIGANSRPRRHRHVRRGRRLKYLLGRHGGRRRQRHRRRRPASRRARSVGGADLTFDSDGTRRPSPTPPGRPVGAAVAAEPVRHRARRPGHLAPRRSTADPRRLRRRSPATSPSRRRSALANSLKYGALPLSFDIGEAQNVAPTLGVRPAPRGPDRRRDRPALVVIYSLLYYRGLGLVTVASAWSSPASLTYATVVLLGASLGTSPSPWPASPV